MSRTLVLEHIQKPYVFDETTAFRPWSTLNTRNLFTMTNFCAAKSIKDFACIQKNANQTTPFKVWWCIDFLIITKTATKIIQSNV